MEERWLGFLQSELKRGNSLFLATQYAVKVNYANTEFDLELTDHTDLPPYSK